MQFVLPFKKKEEKNFFICTKRRSDKQASGSEVGEDAVFSFFLFLRRFRCLVCKRNSFAVLLSLQSRFLLQTRLPPFSTSSVSTLSYAAWSSLVSSAHGHTRYIFQKRRVTCQELSCLLPVLASVSMVGFFVSSVLCSPAFSLLLSSRSGGRNFLLR